MCVVAPRTLCKNGNKQKALSNNLNVDTRAFCLSLTAYCLAMNEQTQNRRITAFWFLMLFFGAVVFVRLVILQGLEYEKYRALAEGQHSFFEALEPKRGDIVTEDSKTGELYPLAMNKKYYQVYLVPREIENPDKVARVLSELLEMDIGEIYGKITKDSEDPYEPLKDKVEQKQIDKIAESDIEGTYYHEKYFRAYPEDDLAAHMIGYLGYSEDGSLKGFGGVEGYYEQELAGEKGEAQIERDAAGRWIPIGLKNEKPAKDGDTVVLTIDRAVQAVVEREMKSLEDKWKPDSISVIVMEPDTGKILAMANRPTFDPNKYNEVEDVDIFNNGAIFQLFEPGSIFKPFVVAAGIDQGIINPEDEFNDSGSIEVSGYQIKNSDDKAHGKQTVTESIDKSLNVILVQIAQKIGLENLYPYFQKFGFGELTNVDLLGEANALLDPQDQWRDTDLATSSFGQGKIFANCMQILKAYSAIPNGGHMVKPRVVDRFVHADGSETEVEPKFVGQPISAKTATTMSAMLVSTVENGYSDTAKVDGYRLAGKTGTAQVPKKDGPGYGSEKITSFVGFGPVDDPKFITIVKVDNPKSGVVWGSTVAAPLFKNIASFMLQYYQIPPSE